MQDQKVIRGLRIKSQRDILREAGGMIKALKDGTIVYYKTGWSCVDDTLNGGFMPQRIHGLAGPSGHGKSYFVLGLQKHILDSVENTRWLEFQYDMPGFMGGLRQLQKQSGIPLNVMLSAKNKIYDATYNKLKNISRSLASYPIDVVEDPGNLDQMEATLEEYRNEYPTEEIIVSLDHARLVDAFAGDDEMTTTIKLSRRMRKWVKDYKITLFPIFQGNTEIENDYRSSPNNPAAHIPKKRDVHGSKQAFHVADTLTYLHQPVLLGITEYGPDQFPTRHHGDNVLVVTVLKNRLGQTNVQTFLQSDLANVTYLNLGKQALRKGKAEDAPGLFDNLKGDGFGKGYGADPDIDDLRRGLEGE